MNYYNYNKAELAKPEAYILTDTGVGPAEIAARTAYDSFDGSENEAVRDYVPGKGIAYQQQSALLTALVHVYHHSSVVEHIVFTFDIRNISRGVLQELSRHRIASPTVRSTRYTMTPIINAYVVAQACTIGHMHFEKYLKDEDFLIFHPDSKMWQLEVKQIYEKLELLRMTVGDKDFYTSILSTDGVKLMKEIQDGNTYAVSIPRHDLLEMMGRAKKKRNAGDTLKHIVTDNWLTDEILTINMRSLMNFMKLRDSGAAYYQMRELAKVMKEALPRHYDVFFKKPKG